MPLIDDIGINYTPFWTFILILSRLSGMFSIAPGIGTDQIPTFAKSAAALGISTALVIAGMRADAPTSVPEAGLMLVSEYVLGFVIGFLPMMIIGGVMVAGQVTTGAIGLGQANIIDPSLGESVAVLARIQSLIGGALFLLIDGHHILIKAVANMIGDIGIGTFRPGFDCATLIIERFASAFDLAVSVSAPILVALLVTQFILGLITKFESKINIFIISLPLTILIGLYITVYTFDGLTEHLTREFNKLPEYYMLLSQMK